MAANRTSASDTYRPELMATGKKNRHFGSPGESLTPPAGRQEPTEPWSNYPEIQGGENARKKWAVGFEGAVGGGWREWRKKRRVKFMRTVRKVMEEMGFVPFDMTIS